MWKDGLDHEQRGAHVEVEYFIEVISCHILQLLIRDDGGVVDEDVDMRAEGFESFVDDLLGCGGLLEVALDSYGAAVSFGFDAGDEVVGAFAGAVAGVGYGYFGAAGGEVEGDCFAYAA